VKDAAGAQEPVLVLDDASLVLENLEHALRSSRIGQIPQELRARKSGLYTVDEKAHRLGKLRERLTSVQRYRHPAPQASFPVDRG